MAGDVGRLIGIARRARRRAPMEEIAEGRVTLEAGLEGDHKGARFRNRAITILSREAWQDALVDAGGSSGPADLPWTTRRANLFVEGALLPRARGARIRIGPVLLEVTYPTQPCSRMDEAFPGLLKALHPDWRGGVTCRVLEAGNLAIGDCLTVEHHPGDERRPRLP
ncbi:MAG: hypothetical protein RLZ98_803 [Pseudomonadota bacterium]|jgi:MOSC domain-containing protein YiiM